MKVSNLKLSSSISRVNIRDWPLSSWFPLDLVVDPSTHLYLLIPLLFRHQIPFPRTWKSLMRSLQGSKLLNRLNWRSKGLRLQPCLVWKSWFPWILPVKSHKTSCPPQRQSPVASEAASCTSVWRTSTKSYKESQSSDLQDVMQLLPSNSSWPWNRLTLDGWLQSRPKFWRLWVASQSSSMRVTSCQKRNSFDRTSHEKRRKDKWYILSSSSSSSILSYFFSFFSSLSSFTSFVISSILSSSPSSTPTLTQHNRHFWIRTNLL